jgi:SAM-dependent methyltransferase
LLDGVPVLVDDAKSLFDPSARALHEGSFAPTPRPRWWRRVGELLPEITSNVASEQNLERVAEMLSTKRRPLVLVLGARTRTLGMEAILDRPEFDCVESDVLPGQNLNLLCDAHGLPFADGSVDCVIAQAVLEHVVDPARCAAEIARVLKGDGVLYAETPFMQQVHEGAFDFTRFTHVGHRRLFRDFDEVDSGVVCGPGTALAWAWTYFLLSFARSSRSRRVLVLVARLTAFWAPWFDAYLARKPAALDAASAFYFLGQKGDGPLDDRDITMAYRGAQR